MKPSYSADDFRSKLKLLRPHLSIQGLADYLGQEKWQVCNWLYRDRPSKWAMEKLMPKLERKITQIVVKKP
jgi:hypothetical protein